MPKKYLLWIVVAVIIVVTVLLFTTNRTEAPVGPAMPVQQASNNDAIEVPEELNLEDSSVDVEGDISDLDVSDEMSEDFDSENFDDETIDESVF